MRNAGSQSNRRVVRPLAAVAAVTLAIELSGAVLSQDREAPGTAGREVLERAARLLESRRPHDALEALDALDALPGPVASSVAIEVGLLRARSFSELEDWPRAEVELRRLLEHEGLPAELVAGVEEELAKALSFEDLHDEALATIDRALRRTDTVGRRRVAAALALRAQDFAAARRHADAVLALARGRSSAQESDGSDPTSSPEAPAAEPGSRGSPDDDYARFVRGIALARAGDLERAVPELERGLRVPDAARDAHFELALALGKLDHNRDALVHLFEILTVDPYDQEACYQASRRLIRRGGAEAARLAAHLARWFETLRAAADPSSREAHLRAAGRGVEADLHRARDREAMGDLEGALALLERALRSSPGAPPVLLARADLFLRYGALAEAERLARSVAPDDSRARPVVERLLSKVDEERRRLRDRRAAADDPLAIALVRVAEATGDSLLVSLRELVAAAREIGDLRRLDRGARLLLALDRRSIPALASLVSRTASPQWIVLHAHYLARASEAAPGEPVFRERLRALRSRFIGDQGAERRGGEDTEDGVEEESGSEGR